jgi:DNA helicase-2/ATP-dependent DNA helicase PcrA
VSETPALDLERLLNQEQLEAAVTTEGPLLILAGAGSGKTRVIVHRIAHILSAGLARPHEIFAVTFTNKAAGEMRSRLSDLIGPDIARAWIGTFHALSARMLRIEGHRLGYDRNFSIYDQDDSQKLMKRILDAEGIDTASRGVSVPEIAHEIDRAKNHGLMPAAFLEKPAGDSMAARLCRKIYPKYQDALRKANAMDFGDLLLLAVELLRHHPEARKRFHDRFRYVMVDEFQDTNAVQYDLLKLLVRPENNLAVVGDDDQAIYRWRGADVANILNFEDEFPNAKIVTLEENYRSTANILAAANAVIKRNAHRHPKTLRTEAAEGARVKIELVPTSEHESGVVARLIRDRIDRGERPEDFAILYRQNAQSRLFEESLRKLRVPFVLIGGTGFYDRMEVKDVLAYLRLTVNPSSSQDFERIVNVPARKIGDKTLELLRRAAEPHGLEGARMLEAPEEAMRLVGLKPSAIAALKALDHLLETFRVLAENASAQEVAKRVIEETGYIHHLDRTEKETAQDRVANVEELVTSIAEHEAELVEKPPVSDEYRKRSAQRGEAERRSGGEFTSPITDEYGLGIAGAKTPLEAFLDMAALTSTNDETSREGAVSMLTLHSAKGLEFPYVFMVGMEEATFPSKRALESRDNAEMEEERRLCYVGMTRAKKELALIAARYRRIYGKVEVRRVSRFLGELPDAVVENLLGRAPVDTAVVDPERAVDRGGDRIVYDVDSAPTSDMEDSRPHAWSMDRDVDVLPDASTFRRGARVFHNSFGEGTVMESDGDGRDARLTIRFSSAGVKRVVARFVRSLEES